MYGYEHVLYSLELNTLKSPAPPFDCFFYNIHSVQFPSGGAQICSSHFTQAIVFITGRLFPWCLG